MNRLSTLKNLLLLENYLSWENEEENTQGLSEPS